MLEVLLKEKLITEKSNICGEIFSLWLLKTNMASRI